MNIVLWLWLSSRCITVCGVLFEVSWPVETEQKPCRDDRADFGEEDIRATPSPHNIPFNYFYNASEKVSGNYAHSRLLWCWRDFFFYSVVSLQGWINLHSTISNTRTDIHTLWLCDGLGSGHCDRINVVVHQHLSSSRVSDHPGLTVASGFLLYNIPTKCLLYLILTLIWFKVSLKGKGKEWIPTPSPVNHILHYLKSFSYLYYDQRSITAFIHLDRHSRWHHFLT